MTKSYRVHFDIEIKRDATEQEVEAFLRFELGQVCSWLPPASLKNLDLQACNVSNVSVMED